MCQPTLQTILHRPDAGGHDTHACAFTEIVVSQLHISQCCPAPCARLVSNCSLRCLPVQLPRRTPPRILGIRFGHKAQHTTSHSSVVSHEVYTRLGHAEHARDPHAPRLQAFPTARLRALSYEKKRHQAGRAFETAGLFSTNYSLQPSHRSAPHPTSHTGNNKLY